MGRDMSAHWASRRASWERHQQGGGPRRFKARTYSFTAQATIRGQTGAAHVEPIATPLTRCPAATTRVIVRWSGTLPPRTTITVDGRPLVVLKVFPITARVSVAHLLCITPETIRRTS